MKIASLEISQFTAFEDVKLSFGPELNVFIGENATGKSHLLKLLYVVTESVRRYVQKEGLGGIDAEGLLLSEMAREMLRSVFLPDTLGRLVRGAEQGTAAARVRCAWDNGAEVSLLLRGSGGAETELTGDFSRIGKAVFVPPRELLSIYPGFVAAWLKRESAFDRTYYELCVELGLNELRKGARDVVRTRLIQLAEDTIQAKVHKKNDRFYLRYDEGHEVEVPLVAEGHRKLGMLAYLLAAGSLAQNGYLLWDEPEASLNPKLSRATGDLLEGLGGLGIQRFVTTHDYVLASELSLRADARAAGTSGVRFFALGRDPETREIVVEAGGRMADLQHNPILDAFGDLHRREQDAFLAEENAK